jgi:hypothetical protein
MSTKVKAFGGVFDTVDAKILEIMVSDPGRYYKAVDFPFAPKEEVEAALGRLVGQKAVFKYRAGRHVLNISSRRVQALCMLALAHMDDMNGTHYLDAALKQRMAAKKRVVWDPPV